MKTLQDVSKVLRREVAKSIYPGVPYNGRSSKAFKTGNLLTSFIKSSDNQFNRIGKKVANGYKFVLNIAPQGAEYGQWVHNGHNTANKDTSKRRFIQGKPYGEIGASSMEFRTEIDLFMIDRVDEMMDGVLQQLDTDFKKAGFKIS